MPSRNVLKIDIEKSFYHVYARGHNGRFIFSDDEDYVYFLDLFARHLSARPVTDQYGKSYQYLRGSIEILGYCIMPDHFHILLYQVEIGAMARIMKNVLTAYSRYFNKKYNSSGSLFETRYKASRISSKQNVILISRYIHLDSGDWQAYPYSSIHAYYGIGRSEWLEPERLIELFPSLPHYADFLDNNSGYKKSLPRIVGELANTITIK